MDLHLAVDRELCIFVGFLVITYCKLLPSWQTQLKQQMHVCEEADCAGLLNEKVRQDATPTWPAKAVRRDEVQMPDWPVQGVGHLEVQY